MATRLFSRTLGLRRPGFSKFGRTISSTSATPRIRTANISALAAGFSAGVVVASSVFVYLFGIGPKTVWPDHYSHSTPRIGDVKNPENSSGGPTAHEPTQADVDPIEYEVKVHPEWRDERTCAINQTKRDIDQLIRTAYEARGFRSPPDFIHSFSAPSDMYVHVPRVVEEEVVTKIARLWYVGKVKKIGPMYYAGVPRILEDN